MYIESQHNLKKIIDIKPFDNFFMFFFVVFRGAVNMLILDLGNLKVNSEKNKVGGDDKVIDVLLTVAQVC